MAKNNVLKIEILTLVNDFSNPFIAFQYYCSIRVRHWARSALIMPTFIKPFFKRTTFDFNQSSMVGIIIINNNNDMKQSRNSLLFDYFIFSCCYLHGVGRIIIVTVELCIFFYVRLQIFLKVSILNGTHKILGIFIIYRIFVMSWHSVFIYIYSEMYFISVGNF